MNHLFYWTGAIIWTLAALALGIVLGWLGWVLTVALARTISALRFTLALRRKRGQPVEPERWVRSTIWIFKQVWDSSTVEIIGKDGSRWNGIGKWSVNDDPWPSTEPEPTAE
jgi:hypothetical protein